MVPRGTCIDAWLDPVLWTALQIVGDQGRHNASQVRGRRGEAPAVIQRGRQVYLCFATLTRFYTHNAL